MIPRQIKECGLTEKLIEFPDTEVKTLISSYTMESGVRNLERAVGSVCRVVAYKFAVCKEPDSFQTVVVDSNTI